jgi:branched-chain amino acid transport system permease protein
VDHRMRGSFQHDWFCGPLVVLVVLLLAGCTVVVESDAVRLCRSLIPAFNSGSTLIDVLKVEAGRTVHGTLVTVSYMAEAQPAPRREAPVKRAISCILKRDPAKPARLDLTNLATEYGPLGDVRLHLLQRHWIESGRAAISDPAPVLSLWQLPHVPRRLAEIVQIAVGSLTNMSIYALLAAAYALIYGLIGRINLAFGELAMVAGYGTFLGFSLFATSGNAAVAILAASALGIWTSATQGGAMSHGVIRPLASRPGQHMLVATIGLSIAWSELVRLTQGSGGRWMAPLLAQPFGLMRSGTYVVTLTPMVLVVLVAALTAVGATLMLLTRSRFGRAWRATADDPFAAALLGIAPQRILFATMLLAAALAGLGGALTALAYGGVGHAGGLVIGLKALIAAVIGGVGSVRGAVFGALMVAGAETLWSAFFPIDYRDLVVFAALAALLTLRPEGLFGGATR